MALDVSLNIDFLINDTCSVVPGRDYVTSIKTCREYSSGNAKVGFNLLYVGRSKTKHTSYQVLKGNSWAGEMA